MLGILKWLRKAFDKNAKVKYAWTIMCEDIKHWQNTARWRHATL